MQIEQTNLEQKNHDLVEAFREKSRTQQQVQKLYQSLKAQVMASHVATAATDEAEHALHTARGNRYVDKIPGTRSGIPNLSQYGTNAHGGGKRHNRDGSGSSGGGGGQRHGQGLSSVGIGPSWSSHTQNVRNWSARMFPCRSPCRSALNADTNKGQKQCLNLQVLLPNIGVAFRSSEAIVITPF